jgi:hypothetical protein
MLKSYKSSIRIKKSQAEVITTVLLILISIAAVILVSNFVINLIKNNLKGTDCLNMMDQAEIQMDKTYYNATSKIFYLKLERGTKETNITGFTVVLSNDFTSKKFEILSGKSYTNIFYYNISSKWANESLIIPDLGETKYYSFNISDFNVSKVSVSIILENQIKCEKSDEKTIPVYA